MTYEAGTGARIITATGEEFVPYTLTPEREDTIFRAIDAHKGAASTGQVAAALKRNVPDASRLLQEMADRGKVMGIPGVGGRVEWQRRDLKIDERLVRQAHIPRIREFLTGRREMPGAIATALRLPRDEVEATCTWMMVHGQLVGTPIGAAMVYALEARVTARVDVRVATNIPMSPQARFQQQLASLGPERPIRLRQAPAPKPAKVKAAPQPKVVKEKAPPKPREPKVRAPRKAKGVSVSDTPRPLPAPRARMKKTPPAQAAAPAVSRAALRQEKLEVARAHREERRRVREEAAALRDAQRRLREETIAARKQAVLDRQAKVAALSTPVGDERTLDAWATEIGVKKVALYKWLNNHPEQLMQCRKPVKALLIPARVVEAYKASSTPKGVTWSNVIPPDSLTMRQACTLLGWSYSKVYRGLEDGQLTAVQAGSMLRFDRATLTAFKAGLDEEVNVPDGWVLVRSLEDDLDLNISSITAWLRRHKHPMRRYRDPARQVALYVEQAGADAYRAYRESTPGGVKITPEIAAQIRAALPPIQPGRKRRPTGDVPAVAKQFGVSVSAVNRLLRMKPARAPLAKAPEQDPAPAPEPEELPVPVTRTVITTELDRQLRADLPPERRRIPGETARVAARYGLTVSQVRYHLRFTPIVKETAHD